MSWPPDRYEGKLVLPAASSAEPPVPPAEPDEPAVFDLIAATIERLYEREPKLTRELLVQLRGARPYQKPSADFSNPIVESIDVSRLLFRTNKHLLLIQDALHKKRANDRDF
jgi:hypothetical protein